METGCTPIERADAMNGSSRSDITCARTIRANPTQLADRAEQRDHVADTLSKQGGHCNRQQEKRDRQLNIDEPHDHGIGDPIGESTESAGPERTAPLSAALS